MNGENIVLGLVKIIIMVLVVVVPIGAGFYNKGYHDGQIAALTGNVVYALETNEVNEVVWVKAK